MKLLKKILALALILALLFGFNTVVLTKYYNCQSMFGSFLHKAERAKNVQGNKCIVIGGSASNLGFDSAVFEEKTGIPAVNMAISAAVPLQVYLNAAQLYAKAGDCVIIPLEYEYYAGRPVSVDETYVDMVSIEPKLSCKLGFYDSIDYVWNGFLRSFTRANDCFNFALKNWLGTENTIYVADSVNEYGDFILHEGRRSTYTQTKIYGRFRYDRQTLEELKAYIHAMEEDGVTVWLAYPPTDGKRYENFEAYYTEAQQAIEQHIGKEHILGTPFETIFEKEDFFDTPYHLLYEKKNAYTQVLSQQFLEKQ